MNESAIPRLIRLSLLLVAVKTNREYQYDTQYNILDPTVQIDQYHSVIQRADDKRTGYNSGHPS